MFDRFGLIRFEAVPLARFGLEKRWKKLDAKQREALALIERYQEAAQQVAALEQGRQAARDKDLDAHAAALRSGDEIPEPAAEAKLDEELQAAIRNRDAYQRATESAIADVTALRAEHAGALAADIAAALEKTALELAKHARQAATLYAAFEDGRQTARQFGPPAQGAPENSGGAQDTQLVVGPLHTTSAGVASSAQDAPPRGDVEAVLSYLVSLGKATVIEPEDSAA